MTETFILRLGGIGGAIVTVGGLLIWIFNAFITKPASRESKRIREEQRRELISVREETTAQLTTALHPLTMAVDRLNHLLEQSEDDRKALHEINKMHNEKLSKHDIELVVLDNFRKDHLRFHNKTYKEE